MRILGVAAFLVACSGAPTGQPPESAVETGGRGGEPAAASGGASAGAGGAVPLAGAAAGVPELATAGASSSAGAAGSSGTAGAGQGGQAGAEAGSPSTQAGASSGAAGAHPIVMGGVSYSWIFRGKCPTGAVVGIAVFVKADGINSGRSNAGLCSDGYVEVLGVPPGDYVASSWIYAVGGPSAQSQAEPISVAPGKTTPMAPGSY